MLVGLKQDLRKGFCTLRLSHLDEPEATTLGEVSSFYIDVTEYLLT